MYLGVLFCRLEVHFILFYVFNIVTVKNEGNEEIIHFTSWKVMLNFPFSEKKNKKIRTIIKMPKALFPVIFAYYHTHVITLCWFKTINSFIHFCSRYKAHVYDGGSHLKFPESLCKHYYFLMPKQKQNETNFSLRQL